MYRVIIFGTGNGAKKVTEILNYVNLKENIEILAYADSKKQGEFLSKRILSIDDLKQIEYDKLIIASDFYEEIMKSLNQKGISTNNVIEYYNGEYWTETKDELAKMILSYRHVFPEFENGHYYSPIPDMNEIINSSDKIFNYKSWNIEGIDLNDECQLNLLEEFSEYYNDMPFTTRENNKHNLRYYFKNSFFEYTDAIILYGMLRKFKPRNLIEIGSGFSSAVTLDTNELFFNNSIKCIFIEPYPERLKGLLKNMDNVKIIEDKLQNININIFDQLESGDILFVDSTHVSKCGSDVNDIMFNILPRLKSGVIVHFHDVFFPFEYPKEWIYEGRFWNEDYVLRAFLQYNSKFEVIYFNQYMNKRYFDLVDEKMPLCLKDSGGSLWIRKK